MSTAAQIRSAIRLRHNSDGHSAAEVLAHCAEGVGKLSSAGKIGPDEVTELRNKIKHAREMDSAAEKG